MNAPLSPDEAVFCPDCRKTLELSSDTDEAGDWFVVSCNTVDCRCRGISRKVSRSKSDALFEFAAARAALSTPVPEEGLPRGSASAEVDRVLADHAGIYAAEVLQKLAEWLTAEKSESPSLSQEDELRRLNGDVVAELSNRLRRAASASPADDTPRAPDAATRSSSAEAVEQEVESARAMFRRAAKRAIAQYARAEAAEARADRAEEDERDRLFALLPHDTLLGTTIRRWLLEQGAMDPFDRFEERRLGALPPSSSSEDQQKAAATPTIADPDGEANHG